MSRRQQLLKAGGMYLAISAAAHLAWEIIQLPLYTLWTSGKPGEIAFAVAHCTVGDVMIAAATLVAGLVITRSWTWPEGRWIALVAATMLAGVAYTGYSEWANVYVRQSWGYSPLMPLLHLGSIALGLSPLLQWVVVPGLAFAALARWSRAALARTT